MLVNIEVKRLDNDGNACADPSAKGTECLVEQPGRRSASMNINEVASPITSNLGVRQELAARGLNGPERITKLSRFALLNTAPEIFAYLHDRPDTPIRDLYFERVVEYAPIFEALKHPSGSFLLALLDCPCGTASTCT
jgi:hypothetical protein